MWSTAANFLSEICQKLNADELKLRLIKACCGIQQSVGDQATDQWRVRLNACIKAKGKHFEDICYDVLFHNYE